MMGNGEDRIFTSIWHRTDGVAEVSGRWIYGGGTFKCDKILYSDGSELDRGTTICGAYCFKTREEAQMDCEERKKRGLEAMERHEHGTASRHHAGCRCKECEAAYKQELADRRLRKDREKQQKEQAKYYGKVGLGDVLVVTTLVSSGWNKCELAVQNYLLNNRLLPRNQVLDLVNYLHAEGVPEKLVPIAGEVGTRDFSGQ